MNKSFILFPGFKPKAFTMSFDDDCDTNGRMVDLLLAEYRARHKKE